MGKTIKKPKYSTKRDKSSKKLRSLRPKDKDWQTYWETYKQELEIRT